MSMLGTLRARSTPSVNLLPDGVPCRINALSSFLLVVSGRTSLHSVFFCLALFSALSPPPACHSFVDLIFSLLTQAM